MLSVYSRHYPPCPSDDINYKRCRCPKWINGILGSDGPFIRRSAKTRSWEKAEDFKRKLEEEYEAKQQGLEEASRPEPALVTVKDAVSRFLTSKRKENLADSTLDKLTTIFEKQFLAWATSYGFVHITEITTADLEDFRDTWTDGPLAKKKKQERLIGFFYYCLRLGWIKSNPAVLLGRIRADGPPTDYFPASEFDKIMDATYIYQPKGWVECRNQATRLRILTLLMRWSGLAIRDAVTLERRRLNEHGELFLYRAKTGSPVYVPLPPDVAEALRNIPPGPSPIRGTSFGPATARRSRWLAIGSEAFGDCSKLQTCGAMTARRSVAIRTCFGTHSRSRCCWPVCRWNRSQCCLVTKA